ncbi:anillin-like isoform X2 [Periplaneta americana]|uniref:anillin-like isoform X2 n=1 Tax=Periplaneta americana TaxID=6978 RepID=UPI0037E98DFE
MDTFTQRMLKRAASWKEKQRSSENRAALMRRTSQILKAINIDFENECSDTRQSGNSREQSNENEDQIDSCEISPVHTPSLCSLDLQEHKSINGNADKNSKSVESEVCYVTESVSQQRKKSATDALLEKNYIEVKIDVHRSYLDDDYDLNDCISPCTVTTPQPLEKQRIFNTCEEDCNVEVDNKLVLKKAEELLLADEICEVHPEEQLTELSSEASYNVESFLREAIGEELLTVARSEPELFHHKSLPLSSETDGDDSDSPYITLKKYRTATHLARQKLRPVLPMIMKEPTVLSTPKEERERKYKELLVQEVYSQKVLMAQCSKALGICKNTREFYASIEHVEAERGLLLASHRCRAALEEMERVQNRKVDCNAYEKGSVVISNILFSLKRNCLDIVNSDESTFWFLCLAAYGRHVFATRATQPGQDGRLYFKESLQFVDLPSDFGIILQVFSLRLRRVALPHEERYHLEQEQNVCPIPFKLPHRDADLEFSPYSKVVKSSPNRTPSFNLIGSLHFGIMDLHVQQGWTFNQIPLSSPLAGDISMMLHASLKLEIEHSGFLSMMEISGLWQRRWCYLKGYTVSYWNYPDDQQLKPPLGQIDLRLSVTDSVSPVDRVLCARPRTLLLEIGMKRNSDDSNSPVETVRHLWQADTGQELMEWCAKLTDVVSALKRWNVFSVE